MSDALSYLEGLTSFPIAASMAQATARYGVKVEDAIKLNSNENVFVPRDFLNRLVSRAAERFNTAFYPREEEDWLTTALSEYTGAPCECIVLGNGSSELLEFVIRVLLRNRGTASSPTPTFPNYRLRAMTVEGKFNECPLRNDFTLDPDVLLDKARESSVLFLCSPNNPTGNQFERSDVIKIIENFPGPVVLDEAYVEFGKYSLSKEVTKYSNLIVLRTFSKAFAMAGARLGYALCDQRLASAFKTNFFYPCVVNSFSLLLGTEAIGESAKFKTYAEELKRERDSLIQSINKAGVMRAFPSDANFYLLHVGQNLEAVFDHLCRRGIFGRRAGNLLNYDGCLRMAVGTHMMNEKVTDALEEAVKFSTDTVQKSLA